MSSTPSTPLAFQKGNTALITGGASGIGLALAQRLLSYGLRVLVVDSDTCSLSRLSSLSPETTKDLLLTFEMDVGNLESWHRLKAHIDDVFNGQLNVLALNAGRYLPTSFLAENQDPTIENFYETMQTNLFGVMNGVTTLLPLVRQTTTSEKGAKGAVIITGSKQGITNPPGNPAYNASKAAVKTLAEHLAFDLAKKSPNVSVHLVVPGWTFTGMTGAGGDTDGKEKKKKKEKPAGAWWPEQVVDYLEEKMKEGKFYAICPDDDVTEDMDRRRMVWAMGDVVENRPPLSRWRAEWKEKAEEGMKKLDV